MRRKILEEYVEHVYRLKVAHQAQLDKVEQIYRSNLEEMSDVVDGNVEAAAEALVAGGGHVEEGSSNRLILCP